MPLTRVLAAIGTFALSSQWGALAASAGTTTDSPGETGASDLPQSTWCQRGDSCWPKPADIEALKKKMVAKDRKLFWDQADGETAPPCAVPTDSPDNQPLYGYGVEGLDAVYVRPDSELNETCYTAPNFYTSPSCGVSVRNAPMFGWQPAFVAWPINEQQVQEAVKFARKHNLCIAVLSTGHDFLNRHSRCPDAFAIRTTLLKGMEWDLTDKKKFGHKAGSVRIGAGYTWGEVHKEAAENDRVVSSGYAKTVGVVGWSLGSGHGPLAPKLGLGGDNILEVDIVTANGTLVTANAKKNSDLFFAVRGGGGTTWGIVTAMTVRAHPIPEGGFTIVYVDGFGDLCEGFEAMNASLRSFMRWSLDADDDLTAIAFYTPQPLDAEIKALAGMTTNCTHGYKVLYLITYQGGEDAKLKASIASLRKGVDEAAQPAEISYVNYPNWWERAKDWELDYIVPWNIWGPEVAENITGGAPSVLISRAVAEKGDFTDYVVANMRMCVEQDICNKNELYLSLTGNKGSPQPNGTAISSGYRTALLHYPHYENGGTSFESAKKVQAWGPNSYFGESDYTMKGMNWGERYWGANYVKLQQIKAKWDPEGVFGCHHCVGDDSE